MLLGQPWDVTVQIDHPDTSNAPDSHGPHTETNTGQPGAKRLSPQHRRQGADPTPKPAVLGAQNAVLGAQNAVAKAENAVAKAMRLAALDSRQTKKPRS